MASSDHRLGSGERWQQSANQLQQSTMDAWRRSTSALSESKDRCHQATMETYHRSADSWTESKDRCRRSTLEAYQRSADTWTESKDRCTRTTLEMVNRSTTQWNESAARLQQMQRQSLLVKRKPVPSLASAQPEESAAQSPSLQCPEPVQSLESLVPDQAPPPQYSEIEYEEPQQMQQPQQPQEIQEDQPSQPSQPSQTSQPSQSSQPSSQTPDSASSPPPETQKNPRTRAFSLEAWKSSRNKPKPEDEARVLFESMDTTVAQVVHAKHLRESKSEQLGEIESNWVNSTITNVENKARGVARILQTYRQDMAKNKGKMSSANRKNWKNKDHSHAEEKHARLQSYHKQLNKVVNHLQDLPPPLEASHPNDPSTPESETPSESSTPEKPVHREETITPDEPTVQAAAELPATEAMLLAELSADPQIAELESTTVIAELPSEPLQKAPSFIAELPADSAIVKPVAPPVPKIVVTNTSDSPTGTMESPKRTDLSYEIHEINEMLQQTRTDTRTQQSESLAGIVARMESTRVQ